MGIGDQSDVRKLIKNTLKKGLKRASRPFPLDADQTLKLINLLKSEHDESDFYYFF
jgi:aconitase B